jgi:two-component system NtrC family sensor kinase
MGLFRRSDSSSSSVEILPLDEKHYRDLWRRQVLRLFFTYLAPLILVTVFFGLQYRQLIIETRRSHLTAIAEKMANTLNLFLMERVANLDNLVDDPDFLQNRAPENMSKHLVRLTALSETFVDLGFFDEKGLQTLYSGPFPSLQNQDYGSERWFQELKNRTDQFVVTDIYFGFRNQPHFTIAVSRTIDGEYSVLRATLAPQKIYDYMVALEGADEVYVSIVNRDGTYQLVTPHIGTLLENSSLLPPRDPGIGAQEVQIDGASLLYAYAWLQMCDWALIVQPATERATEWLPEPLRRLLLIMVPVTFLVGVAVFNRARKLVILQRDADRTRAQLEHASKLASVGELAAGIAHEINNPLAVINEEAGLVKDLLNPVFGSQSPPEELVPHLDNIEKSVLRCRDITHKLLGFVRKSDVELRPQDIHEVIEGVVGGLLGRGLEVSDVEIDRQYDPDLPEVLTDGNQLQQVLLNIVNNAVDALEGNPGKLTLRTFRESKRVHIAISDTGKGMTADQIGKVFLPFYTTKEVGKGTGLGLPVSYGIMEDLGGEIRVKSRPGKGSTFTVVLPVRLRGER